MVVARPADVGMEDRGRVRWALWRGPPVELVVEDGFDGAIGPGADLDGPVGGGFDAHRAKGTGKPDDAETGAIALLGMGPGLEDVFAERRGRRADLAGVFPDALDRPAGVAPMAGGHVLGNRRVLPVPARPYVDGDALALVENLDAADGQARLDLGAGKTVRDGIIVGVDVDVIVDADPADAPLAVFVSAVRQRLERWAIDLFEQLAAGDAEPPQALLLIELGHELAKRGVDVGEAIESSAPQPAEQPALDDQDGLLDLRLVARLPGPGGQDGGSIMGRHLGIGSVDLRVVEAGLDDSGFGVVRHDEFGNPADRLEGARMGVDPVGERLRPGRLGEGEARGAQHGDEDLRYADFAGEAVDDDRHAVAGVIDEQPLAGRVRLAHRHRQRLLEGAIELAEPRVAVAVRVGGDIFVPQDQQGDVLALQLAMHGGPIRLRDPPVAAFAAPAGVERRLQRLVVHALRQGPGEACSLRPLQRLPHTRAGH